VHEYRVRIAAVIMPKDAFMTVETQVKWSSINLKPTQPTVSYGTVVNQPNCITNSRSTVGMVIPTG
jgi:hypothetical protein